MKLADEIVESLWQALLASVPLLSVASGYMCCLTHFNVQPVAACCVVSGHVHVGVFYVVVVVRVEHFHQLVMAVLCAELISLLKFRAVAPILICSGTAVVFLHRNFSFGELIWLERVPAGKSLLSDYVCGCRNSCATR